MSRGNHGPLITRVLFEALHKFGSITPQNRDQVASYVQRRVRQIESGAADLEPYQPRVHDPKARAAGEDR